MQTQRRRRLLILLAGGSLLGGVGVAGCGSSSDGGSTTAASAPTPAEAAAPAAASAATVGMEGISFTPATVGLKAGGTVTWKNTSDISHNVTGDGYASKTLDVGDTFEHTYDTPGTYSYMCTFHAGMNGTVKVS